MKYLYCLPGLILFCLPSLAQIKFEPAYFISNNGKITSCLIKNQDWKNNPSVFEYKLNETSAAQQASIDSITEFGIDNFSKYKRYTVNIDQSMEDLRKLSTDRQPEFKTETVFLKVLAEGNASLYFYENSSFTRFFLSMDSLQPEQLIYKTYLVDQTGIAENAAFRNQLFSKLTCGDIQSKDVEKLKYEKEPLEKMVLRYNECSQGKTVSYTKTTKKDLFNFSVRPGINYSSFSVENDVSTMLNRSFGHKINFRFGVESELLLPFRKNKWAIIAEPAFQMYKYAGQEGTKTTTVDYKSIELNGGLRYYIFLSDQSKIFINSTIILDIPISSYLQVNGGSSLKFSTTCNGSIGAGFKYKNRFAAELRYQLERDVFVSYYYWWSSYKTTSLIFSYTLF